MSDPWSSPPLGRYCTDCHRWFDRESQRCDDCCSQLLDPLNSDDISFLRTYKAVRDSKRMGLVGLVALSTLPLLGLATGSFAIALVVAGGIGLFLVFAARLSQPPADQLLDVVLRPPDNGRRRRFWTST